MTRDWGEGITRHEFGARVARLLTDEQRRMIRELHDQVEEGWLNGCAAANEGANCCVDEIVEAIQ